MTETALMLAQAMPKKRRADSDFGRRLTELRRQRGITQVQLAELIDSSQRAISHYETVAEFPPAPVLILLARALGVSADELLGIRPLKKAGPVDDPDLRRLWKSFQKILALPEKDRRAVFRLVNSLAGGRDG